MADRFHNASEFDSASGAAGEQRSEEKVVPRGNENDIVIFRIKFLE